MTLLHHLLKRKTLSQNDVAIKYKDEGRWISVTWRDYFNLIAAAAAGLAELNLQRGDRVAIILETRPEWIIADLAILGLGAVTVPIYPNNLDEDVQFILNDIQAPVLILEVEQLAKWERIKNQCPSVKHLIVIDDKRRKAKDGQRWADLLQKGRALLTKQRQFYVDSAKATTLQDTATILYTSGTTGRPKGVVLTHEQIMSELVDVFSVLTVTSSDTSLSFLPYSHIFGRVEAWGSVYAGFVLAFAESVNKIRQNLKEVRPTFMVAVPRIFEKIHAEILSQVENSQIKRKIFELALATGQSFSEAVQKKKPLGFKLTLEYEIAKAMVFDKVLKTLGGRMRFAISGGAPLSAEITRFFHGLGLLICEGYGLTETTAGICFNTPGTYRFGSVGHPLADVKIKIAEDGEIWVKSKKVMKEYYKNAEATAEVFVTAEEDMDPANNKYFKTGDIGHFDEDGFLYITDRKKDLIKTAGGKYVAPQKLEGLLKLSPYISNVLIHGDQKKYIIALITVSPQLREKSQEHETYNLIKNAVAEANTNLASFESIKKFAILPNDFTVETGELTPSLKVKRKYCDQKFKKEIDELY